MKITLYNEMGDMYNLEVSDDMDLASFKALCEVETSIPTNQISLEFEGKELNDDSKALNLYNIRDGEVLVVKRKENQTIPNLDFSNIVIPNNLNTRSNNPNNLGIDPVELRNSCLRDPASLALLRHNNPSMAAALEKSQEEFTRYINEQRRLKMEEQEKLKRLLANPFDQDAQRLIAEEIRKQNVEKNMEDAMEYHPGLMDSRFAGTARGVGVQKISGKIHLTQIQIEQDFLPTSFTILEDQDMDVMLGLDMLKRHQCCIDLKRNVLVIGTTGTETRFLSESEIPANVHENLNEDMQLNEAINRSIAETKSSSTASDSKGEYSEALLNEFLSMGFKRELIITFLKNFNNNKEEVLAALLASSLSMPQN